MIGLIGNKADLDAQRRVTTEEGEQYAKANQLLFYETSAKDASNVDEAFLAMARGAYKTMVEKGIIRDDNFMPRTTSKSGGGGIDDKGQAVVTPNPDGAGATKSSCCF